jgi:hypothetical protein
MYHVTNALWEHAWSNPMEMKPTYVDITFGSMTLWRLLQGSIYIKVTSKKVFFTFVHLDITTTCANRYVVALLRLRFRLSGEVRLMLTFTFVFVLLVKVNKVFGVRHERDQCSFAPLL